MKPWMIERIEEQRREREKDHRQPLYIPPPQDWRDHPESRPQEQDETAVQRGVFIIDL